MYALRYKFSIFTRCIMLAASVAEELSEPDSWKQALQDMPSEPVMRDMAVNECRIFLRIADTVDASGEALNALRDFVVS